MTSGRRKALWLAFAFAVAGAPELSAHEEKVAPALSSLLAPDGRLAVYVDLGEPPAARIYARTLQRTGMQRSALDAAASQVQRLKARQDAVRSTLSRQLPDARELYAVQRVLNGFVMSIDPADLERLRRVAGVRRVEPMPLEYPTNGTSVPHIGAPAAWEGLPAVGGALDGSGIRIGIIDTGVDYQHATFGGSGALADYQANDRTVAPDAFFPSAKVVAGWDFAGDSYNGTAATIAPDPDPMDCNGHGTHVAATAAGFGVNADGTPYTGMFSPSLPFAGLRVGPGVAPRAQIVPLRVFGCGGGTSLTVQAIEWSIDPNGDGDFSDRLDVINMSLGSAFGSAFSATSVAADNAAAAGVIVVASAGNSGDTYFITGAPGTGDRVISTAGSADQGQAAAALRVDAPAAIAGFYVAGTAAFGNPPPLPGLSGSVVLALDAADADGPLTTDGCSALTNAAEVAGRIALIDRGTCGFAVKVKNAQDAGAIAAIIANTSAGAFGNMGGDDPAITIPSVMVTFADGNTLKANIATLQATLLNGADTPYLSTSRGARVAAGSGRIALKPDVTAPGVSITSAQTGVTCTGAAPSTGCQVPSGSGFIADSQALVLSGTSMAAPHIAGVMALLRQRHPAHSVEELKALVMNGALQDITTLPGGGSRLGSGRNGAGRTDVAATVSGNVLAMNADGSGTVSLSFDGSIVAAGSQVRRLRVVNHGASPASFNLAIDTVVDAPGVAFSLPGGNAITVPANGAVEIDVRMDANANQMTHTRDASVAATQTAPATPASVGSLGALNRHWMTEESAFVELRSGGDVALRVPLYVAARPASRMVASGVIPTGGAATGSTTLPLSGMHLCTGSVGAGPTCTGSFPTDEVSLATPFELGAISPPNPTQAPPSADVRYVGVAYSAASDQLLFGVAMHGPWTTPTEVAVNIYVDCGTYSLGASTAADTCNGVPDGVWDLVLFNTNPGSLANLFGVSAAQQDAFITAVYVRARSSVVFGPPNYVNRVSAGAADTRVFANDVMFLPVDRTRLKVDAATGAFTYEVRTCPGTSPLCQELNGFSYDHVPGPLRYNYLATNQGLDFGGGNLFFDLNGASIPVTWNSANLASNGSLGALVLHHHNEPGATAQVVALEGMDSTDLAVSHAVTPATPTLGATATLSVTVQNPGGSDATGVVVRHVMPEGLLHVSDDSSGTYDPLTGLWSIGNLEAGGSVTLQLQATVTATAEQVSRVQVSAAAPLDTNPLNDAAQLTLNAAASADLALSMSVSAPTVQPGDTIEYTLEVENLGGSQEFSIVTSALFAGVTGLLPVTITPGSGTYDAATSVWHVASLDSGRSATLTLGFTVPDMAGPLTLQGNTSGSGADPDTGNNSASATTQVLSPADVTATKAVTGSMLPGGTVTYTVTLTNNGSAAQQDNPGNEFTDVLPAGLELLSATGSAGTTVASTGTNTVSWNGAIAAGGSVTIEIQAQIVAAGGATVSNQGTVSTDLDGDGSNETTRLSDDPGLPGTDDATVFLVRSPADITVSKRVTGDFTPGSTVRYTIQAVNHGAGAQFDNAGPELVDALPAGLTLMGADADAGAASMSGNTVEWNGSIPAGGSVTITIDATIDSPAAAGTVISNSATFNADTDGDLANDTPVPSDDPDTQDPDDATRFTVTSPAAITASKQVSGSFVPGGTVQYTIVLQNQGAAAQGDNPGDEFVDVLPATLGLVSATASSGTAIADASSNTVRWNGSITAGGSVTVTITATIAAGTTGGTQVANQGTVAFDADGDGSNEASGVTNDPDTAVGGDPTVFTVLSPATLAATKTASGTVRVGDDVTYTIVLTNTGSHAHGDNPGDELVDVLPASLQLVSAQADRGTVASDVPSRTVRWNGALAAGESATITIVARVATASTSVSNQATVHFDADGDGSNESQALSDDPALPGPADATVLTGVAPPAATPVLVPGPNAWMLLLLGVLVMLAPLTRRRPH